MLRPPEGGVALQQGDLIRDVPFLVLRKVINIKAEGVPHHALDCQAPESFESAKGVSGGKPLTATEVPVVLQTGMIVTQSCDLDYKDHVTLVRVFPLASMVKDAKDAIDHNEPLVLYDVIKRLTEGADYSHLVYVGDP